MFNTNHATLFLCAGQTSAQRTGVIRIPGFFSAADIAEVHRAAQVIGDEAGTCIRADSRWCVFASFLCNALS